MCSASGPMKDCEYLPGVGCSPMAFDWDQWTLQTNNKTASEIYLTIVVNFWDSLTFTSYRMVKSNTEWLNLIGCSPLAVWLAEMVNAER